MFSRAVTVTKVAARATPRASRVARAVHMDAKAVAEQLTSSQSAVAEKLAPWFVENMPSSYFRQMDQQTQSGHLRTLSAHFDPAANAFRSDAGRVVHESLNTLGQKEITFMEFGSSSHDVLIDQVDSLSAKHGDLARVKVYTSADGQLCFNVYTFHTNDAKVLAISDLEEPEDSGRGPILAYAKQLQEDAAAGKHLPHGLKWDEIYSQESLESFMGHCTAKHVVYSRPKSFLHQRRLFEQVKNTENVAISFERSTAEDGSSALADPQYWIRIAETNVVPQISLCRILGLLKAYELPVSRMHLDVIGEGEANSTTMIRLLVDNPEGAWQDLERELKRLKWADDHTLRIAYHCHNHEHIGIIRAEVMTALLHLTHPILSKQNAFSFTRTNVMNVLDDNRNRGIGVEIADLFIERFKPDGTLSEEQFQAKLESIRENISRNVEDFISASVLRKMVDSLEATLRTNLFLENRYALAIRVDPRIFRADANPQLAWNDPAQEEQSSWTVPYGTFFSHGRRFNGFHVRFRDIARGGLRLVSPNTASQHAMESGRHFGEAYDLAFGQQLKNKDIPEGGSKCVVLTNMIDEHGHEVPTDRFQLILRKSVKAFTDSLLDLIVKTDETDKLVKDYFGKREQLYLGPDEQVIPADINWIVKRAAERGYPIPNAFMSSKPETGINHKEFGVTSEGVLVFLDEALKHIGLDPMDPSRTEPVTIKMTGGPGGDVAGNMIRLLKNMYGNKVSIVALCDGSGSLEDPNGLDMDELMRLFEHALDVDSFDTTKLSSKGAIHLVHTEEGRRARNTMHNRVIADAFIPGGGRPNTVDETNWRNFLQPNGEPSAKVVVEGANVFFTAGARAQLFEHCKLPIVKDSSANKCGVICSSYEIMSSMLLSEKEFTDNKKQIVSDVIARLQDLARKEAQLMFHEFSSRPGALPKFSQDISNAINRLTDAISARLEVTQEHLDPHNDSLRALLHAHLPAKLDELAGDRIYERVPDQYIKSIVASALASKIVYREGVLYIEEQDDDRLADIAFNYLKTESQVNEILEAMNDADWRGCEHMKESAMEIVQRGGVRVLQK